MTEYVELTIKNNAGDTSPIKDSSLYISLYAGSTPYTIDAMTGFCSAGSAGDTAIPIQFSNLANKVLKLDSSEQMISGRLYFSSSSTPISSGGPSITECPDYFDWLEFTLNGPSATSKQLVINTTQVDQFGFPITINDMAPPDPVYGTAAGIEPSATRSGILNDFKKLPSPYKNCLLKNSKANTDPDLRILSPGNAIVKDPSSDLAGVFSEVLKKFFEQAPYEPKPDQLMIKTPVYIDSVAGYPYVGILTEVTETGIDGYQHVYPVLQFNYAGSTDAPNPLGIANPPPTGTGPYNIYFPLFNSNAGVAYPPPPHWWMAKSGIAKGSLPKESTPSQMVFSANGAFADNAFQLIAGKFYSTQQQKIIGDLENQLNVAFNRGFANSFLWQTLTGSIAPSGNTKNSAGFYESVVTLGAPYTNQNLPNTAINLNVGMQVLSYASSQPLKISAIPIASGNTFTVISEKEILAQNTQYLAFSHFYEGIEVENSYAKFFHQTSITIGGRAYAMPFDDQGGFSSTLTSNWQSTPTSLTITLGAWD